jgi:hypothetical protein
MNILNEQFAANPQHGDVPSTRRGTACRIRRQCHLCRSRVRQHFRISRTTAISLSLKVAANHVELTDTQ